MTDNTHHNSGASDEKGGALDTLMAAIESAEEKVRSYSEEIAQHMVSVISAEADVQGVRDELGRLASPVPPEGDADFESLFDAAEEEDDAADASVAADGESGEDADESDDGSDTDADSD